MKQLLSLAAAALVAIGANAHVDGTTRYKVDANASTISWHATKVTGEHSGTVGIQNGFLSSEDGALVAANIIADMTQIRCTDLEGEWADKLVGHLNSEDFFAIEEFKTSSFSLKAFKPLPNNEEGMTHEVSGEFTIRDQTHPVTFLAKVTEADGQLTIDGNVELDRSKYNVRYGSGSFFDDLGDNLIHDNFTVGFSLVATAM